MKTLIIALSLFLFKPDYCVENMTVVTDEGTYDYVGEEQIEIDFRTNFIEIDLKDGKGKYRLQILTDETYESGARGMQTMDSDGYKVGVIHRDSLLLLHYSEDYIILIELGECDE